MDWNNTAIVGYILPVTSHQKLGASFCSQGQLKVDKVV